MPATNRIVGVLRFSYPASDGFAASHLSEAALEATLYDEARLAIRLRYLETIALPSLAAQTDADFTLVLIAGATLPKRWRLALRMLETVHPFLRVLFLDRMGALAAARRAFRLGLEDGPEPTHVTGFRIDDDDAVATDYMARTRDLADRMLRAGLADAPTAIAFAHGLYWDLHDPDAPFRTVRETRPLGLACAMVTTAALETCIYRYNHRRLPAQVPTLMLPGEAPMFLRTLHGHNDSGRADPAGAAPLPTVTARRLLRDRFGLDDVAAMALMPVPAAG